MRAFLIAALSHPRRGHFNGLVMRVLSGWVIERVTKNEVQQGLRTMALRIQRFRYKALGNCPPHCGGFPNIRSASPPRLFGRFVITFHGSDPNSI
jgi:hypothetical protein